MRRAQQVKALGFKLGGDVPGVRSKQDPIALGRFKMGGKPGKGKGGSHKGGAGKKSNNTKSK